MPIDWSHQQRALDSIRRDFSNGYRYECLVIPTGGGKTETSRQLMAEVIKYHNRCVFIADRRELVYQAARAIAKHDMPVGVVMADAGEDRQGVDWNRPEALIQVCSKQSVAAGYPIPFNPNLIITDECHTSITDLYQGIVRRWRDGFEVGLTATPVRADGKGLGTRYQRLVCPTTYAALQAQGVLVPVICKSIRGKVQTKDMGGQKPTKKTMVGDPVKWWMTYGYGRKTFAFCQSVAESRGLQEEFRRQGIKCGHVDGTMHKDEARQNLEAFKAGEIMVLTNCDMMKYGVDVPDASCCLINRPFASFVDYRQATGRVLRAAPDKKDALIIDMSGAVAYHDYPDVDFEWTLDGDRALDGERKKAIKDGKIAKLITCPQCYTAFRSRSTCPSCNWAIPEKRGQMERNKGGTLVDVRRGDGRTMTMNSSLDLNPAWRQALAIAANRGQSFRVAAGIFRGKAGRMMDGKRIEQMGLDPLPKASEWNKPVAEVLPQYVRRKSA